MKIRKKDIYGSEVKLMLKYFNFKDKKVLDLGCGEGILASKLAKHCKLIIGLDPSIKDLNKARKKTTKKIKFKKGSAGNIPFKDNSFDCVVCALSLHHIKNLNKVLKEIKRVLNKNGKLIIIEGGVHSPFEEFYSNFKDEYFIQKKTKLYLNKQKILKKELFKIVEFYIENTIYNLLNSLFTKYPKKNTKKMRKKLINMLKKYEKKGRIFIPCKNTFYIFGCGK